MINIITEKQGSKFICRAEGKFTKEAKKVIPQWVKYDNGELSFETDMPADYSVKKLQFSRIVESLKKDTGETNESLHSGDKTEEVKPGGDVIDDPGVGTTKAKKRDD